MKQTKQQSRLWRSREMLRLTIFTILAIALSGCAGKVTYEINPDPCIIFDPIVGSSRDTIGTLEQLEDYNDLYRAICNEN